MIAALAVDCIERETPNRASSDGPGQIAPRRFTAEEVDPIATLIARLDREIERRDFALDEPFTLVVSRRSSIPLSLCGTTTFQPCDESHAGRCRRVCDSRSREWRAELDVANSGPDGAAGDGPDDHERYELAYRVRWTSDWYRDDLATLMPTSSHR